MSEQTDLEHQLLGSLPEPVCVACEDGEPCWRRCPNCGSHTTPNHRWHCADCWADPPEEPLSDERSRLFWTGWVVPDDVPDEHMMEEWPVGMRAWHTGYGDGYTTWVAAVWAADRDHAKELVHGCYGPSASRLPDWIYIREIDPSTATLSDRYPGGIPEEP